MNGLWKKRIPAFLLTLVMIVSLMPAALATEDPAGDPPAPPQGTCADGNHVWSSEYTSEGASGHHRVCTSCSTPEPSSSHSLGAYAPTKSATCKDGGEEQASCTANGCDYKETRTTTTVDHKYATEWGHDAANHFPLL